MAEPPRPCQKLACNIQACLQKNDYQADRCRDAVELYQQCIRRVEQATAAAAPPSQNCQ